MVLACGSVHWIANSDHEEMIDATMGELARLFPTEIAADPAWPATKNQGPNGQARLRKQRRRCQGPAVRLRSHSRAEQVPAFSSLTH